MEDRLIDCATRPMQSIFLSSANIYDACADAKWAGERISDGMSGGGLVAKIRGLASKR